MSAGKITLPPQVMAELRRDADALGLSPGALLTADYTRWRRLAEGAAPDLATWEWGLLGHVLDGIEAERIMHGIDDLPSAAMIAAEIEEWADVASGDDLMAALRLQRRVAQWSPLAVAGVLIGLRRHTES